jgi:hypothetical protein
MRKKWKKSKLYYSSKKALEKSRMTMANNEFKFRGPSKLLDYGDANVADVVGVTDGDLQAIHKLEETMNTDIIDAECVTEEIISPAPQFSPKHLDNIHLKHMYNSMLFVLVECEQ